MVIVKPKLGVELIPELHQKTLFNLGYKTRAPGKEIEETISEALNSVIESAHPRGIFRFASVVGVKKKEVITELGAVRSQMFARLTKLSKGKKSLVFMIATIGEEWKQNLGKDASVLRQLIFDAVASQAVERLADLIEKQWREEAESKGLKASLRFSPGYCDWDLKEQKVIFNALEAKKIGVKLTRYYVMIPQKTISAVALLAEHLPIPAPCAFCPKECRWRKIPYQSGG